MCHDMTRLQETLRKMQKDYQAYKAALQSQGSLFRKTRCGFDTNVNNNGPSSFDSSGAAGFDRISPFDEPDNSPSSSNG